MGLLPFDHYPGDPDAVGNAAGKARDQQATFGALKTNLSDQNDKAANEVVGDLDASISAATQSAQTTADEAAGAALVGSGAMNHFANAIRTYNGHVDDLNDEYERQKNSDFGIGAEEGFTDGNTDEENATARQSLIDDEDQALQQRLEEDRKDFEAELDDAADYAAALLVAGPTQAVVLSLFITGDIDIEAAAAALGTTLSALNNVRMWTATLKGVVGFKDSLPALTQYLLKKDLNKLTRGSMTVSAIKRELRSIVRTNAKSGMPFAQRVKSYKAAKQILRGSHLLDSLKPGGNLFGKYGSVPRHASSVSKAFRAFGKFGSFAGKALPFLAIPAGAYGLYDTYANRDSLTTPEEVNGYVGSGATLLGGGVAAGMIIAGAFPPAGLAIAGVAGVIALGSLAVDVFNWEDDLADAAEWTKDTVSDIGGALSDGAEAVGDFFGF